MSGLPDPHDAAAVASWKKAAVAFLRQTLAKDKMSTPPSVRSSPKSRFSKRVEEYKTSKGDINALILDYLTTEGYPNAAAKFSKEANLQPHQTYAEIEARQRIKNSIHRGDIQTAIEYVNDLDPEILDEDKALHFSLLRLQLVELIKSCNAGDGNIAPALKFATEQLAPRAPTNPQFLEDLEQTMALLLFPQDELDPHLAALLDPKLRRDAAAQVNSAILKRQARGRDAAIRQLVKVRAWAENATRAKKNALPEHLDIGLKSEEIDSQLQPSLDAENGHDPMMIT